MRSIAGADNVGEGGVGASVATDLAERSPSRQRRRSVYNPVMRWAGVHYYLYLLSLFFLCAVIIV